MSVEWHPFDYDNQEATRPPHNGLVWAVDEYADDAVAPGYFDGQTFRTHGGSDDWCVSHWAEMDVPDAPPRVHRVLLHQVGSTSLVEARCSCERYSSPVTAPKIAAGLGRRHELRMNK